MNSKNSCKVKGKNNHPKHPWALGNNPMGCHRQISHMFLIYQGSELLMCTIKLVEIFSLHSMSSKGKAPLQMLREPNYHITSCLGHISVSTQESMVSGHACDTCLDPCPCDCSRIVPDNRNKSKFISDYNTYKTITVS